MIIKYQYTKDHDREEVSNYISEIKSKNGIIIDIGGTFSSVFENDKFINKSRDATVDLLDLPTSKLHFKGNVSLFNTWIPILDHVNKHGKFDFCYISHLLEDIANPKLVCNLLSQIAKEGFIAIPSKYIECSRLSTNPFRGFIHHRWIFNIEKENFVCYPKLNFLEYLNHLDLLSTQKNTFNEELQVYWKNEINLNIVNNDFMGPDPESVKNYYNNLHLN